MNKYVFIQARTNSNRLFGKCLFKIKNIESILILYNRIKSKDYKTIILTSETQDDDYLVKILKNNNVPLFRGNISNVRDRFLKCSKNYNDSDLIIRCTADNLFVDKIVIKYLIKKFLKTNVEYIAFDQKKSNLPYGLNAEIFSVNALRNYESINKQDDEHVTIPILRKSKKKLFIKLKNKINLSNYSCTIDNLTDFFKVKYVFENFNNNLNTNWDKLCNCLPKVRKQEINKQIQKKFGNIILGTAQIGFKYGVNNRSIITSKQKKQIIDYAIYMGINYFDTARSYGASEKILGKFLVNKNVKFITKFSYPKISEIEKSLKMLKRKKIDTILIHNPENFIFPSNQKLNNYKKIKNIFKYTNNLGFSLNSEDEFYELKKLKKVKTFQIPFNILDHRWRKIINQKNKNYQFIARSIFLQGLLFNEKNYQNFKFKEDLKKIIKKIKQLTKKLGRFDTKDLLIAYVRSIQNIDKIVVGIDNLKQIKQLPFYFLNNKITKKELDLIRSNFKDINSDIIKPFMWN